MLLWLRRRSKLGVQVWMDVWDGIGMGIGAMRIEIGVMRFGGRVCLFRGRMKGGFDTGREKEKKEDYSKMIFFWL